MGKEVNESSQYSIIDFLYKDTSMINSFYSQLFNGLINNVTKSETSAVTSDTEMNISAAGIVGAKFNSHDTTNQVLQSSINPLDSTILELIESLKITKLEGKLSSEYAGKIVCIKGNLLFRDYSIINEIMPLITKSNLIPEFSKPLTQNQKGGKKKYTTGDLIQDIIKIMPIGLEFEVRTNENEIISAIIKNDCLTISPIDMFRTFGNTLPNEWTVVGIMDEICPPDIRAKSDFKKAIDEITGGFTSIINDMNIKYVIRPLVIYRKIVQ